MCNTKMSFYIKIISGATFLKCAKNILPNTRRTGKKTRPQRRRSPRFVILIHVHFAFYFVFIFQTFTFPLTELIFKYGIRITSTRSMQEHASGNCFVCPVRCSISFNHTHPIAFHRERSTFIGAITCCARTL